MSQETGRDINVEINREREKGVQLNGETDGEH